MNRRFFLFGGAAAIILAAGGYGWLGRTPKPPEPADVLFALSLPDLEGQPQSLADWKGQPMVINFWATWCAPCVKELPRLDALQKNYPQVRFVGIGVDTADNIRTFTRKIPVSYSLLVMDTGGPDTLRAVGDATAGLPFTLVVNARGHIEKTIVGQVNSADLIQALAQLGG